MPMISNDLGKILAWAKLAKAIYVPLQGSGGASVKVDRKDFIEVMRSLDRFDGHATYNHNCNMYIGG